jgi:rifampin ADP-ribosylating transferase
MTYYHGGAPGFKVGGLILPSNVTGAPSLAAFGAGTVCRTDRAYITTDINAAAMYAAFHPSGQGSIYEVEPDFPLDNDPDCTVGGLSYATTRAIIVKVHDLSSSEIRKIREIILAAA